MNMTHQEFSNNFNQKNIFGQDGFWWFIWGEGIHASILNHYVGGKYTFILCAEILWCIFVGWTILKAFFTNPTCKNDLVLSTQHERHSIKLEKVVEFLRAVEKTYMLWTRWTISPKVHGRQKTYVIIETGWWFQPIWKILVKWEIFPK